jgi:hypothetical protein
MTHQTPVYGLGLVQVGTVVGISPTCLSPHDAYDAFRSHLGEADHKHLLAIYMDDERRVLGLQVVAAALREFLDTEAKMVFTAGLLLRASAVVLIHGHPAGDCMPTVSDTLRTRELETIGFLLGISVVDHVVVSGADYTSMRAMNRMLVPPSEGDRLSHKEISNRLRRLMGLHRRAVLRRKLRPRSD